jgi:hypothetical protein
MAVTNTAAFGQTPFLLSGLLTAAKAAPLAGNTNAVNLGNVGVNGGFITGAVAIPSNTIASASLIALYYSPDGTNLYVIATGTLAIYTFSATAAPTALNLSNLNGSVISATNPLYIPYAAAGGLWGSTAVALATSGVVLSVNGTNL